MVCINPIVKTINCAQVSSNYYHLSFLHSQQNVSKCHEVNSFWKFGHLNKSEERSVVILGMEMSCGTEPFCQEEKKFTISLDAVFAQTFSPCLRTPSTTNFNGTIYQCFADKWDTMKLNFRATQSHINETFTAVIDKSAPMLEQILHAGKSQLVNSMGELNGSVNEQGSTSMKNFIETTKEEAANWQIVSTFGKLKTIVVATIVILLLGLSVYVLSVYTNLFLSAVRCLSKHRTTVCTQKQSPCSAKQSKCNLSILIRTTKLRNQLSYGGLPHLQHEEHRRKTRVTPS